MFVYLFICLLIDDFYWMIGRVFYFGLGDFVCVFDWYFIKIMCLLGIFYVENWGESFLLYSMVGMLNG